MQKVRFMSFFSLCDLNELECAAHCLQLGLSEQTLAARYYKFGGTARYILTVDTNFYEHGVESLEDAYSTFFKTYEQLSDAFFTAKKHISTSADKLRLCHRLFYYVPCENYRKCQTILGSAEIVERFDFIILALKEKERNMLVRSLDVGFAGSIVGRIFESFVYERLSRGIKLDMRQLLSNDPMKTLIIPPNSYFRIKGENQSLAELFDTLLIPEDPNTESVDCAFLDNAENILYMFQITIRKTHPVSCDGLSKLVEVMQMAEAIVNEEIKPFLVFIVPEDIESNFLKQSIREVTFAIPDKFDRDKALEFGTIKGLRQLSIEKLIKAGARSLGDLREMFKAGKVQYKAVENFFKPRNVELIEKIRECNQLVASFKFPTEDNMEIDELKE
jgi:hypothetical protein